MQNQTLSKGTHVRKKLTFLKKCLHLPNRDFQGRTLQNGKWREGAFSVKAIFGVEKAIKNKKPKSNGIQDQWILDCDSRQNAVFKSYFFIFVAEMSADFDLDMGDLLNLLDFVNRFSASPKPRAQGSSPCTPAIVKTA